PSAGSTVSSKPPITAAHHPQKPQTLSADHPVCGSSGRAPLSASRQASVKPKPLRRWTASHATLAMPASIAAVEICVPASVFSRRQTRPVRRLSSVIDFGLVRRIQQAENVRSGALATKTRLRMFRHERRGSRTDYALDVGTCLLDGLGAALQVDIWLNVGSHWRRQ